MCSGRPGKVGFEPGLPSRVLGLGTDVSTLVGWATTKGGARRPFFALANFVPDNPDFNCDPGEIEELEPVDALPFGAAFETEALYVTGQFVHVGQSDDDGTVPTGVAHVGNVATVWFEEPLGYSPRAVSTFFPCRNPTLGPRLVGWHLTRATGVTSTLDGVLIISGQGFVDDGNGGLIERGWYVISPADPVRLRCDFNADGNVDVDDFGDFINAYFSMSECSDLDGNGQVDADDLGDGINLYFLPQGDGGCA